MPGERYYLHNAAVPGGWRDLPGTMRPSGNSPPTSSNLVRARGYTQVYDLSDGIPEPVPISLTGFWETDDEHQLSAQMDWWTWFIYGCTQYRRDNRPPDDVQGGSLIWSPVDDDSSIATVTITLIPARVRNPAVLPSGALKGF